MLPGKIYYKVNAPPRTILVYALGNCYPQVRATTQLFKNYISGTYDTNNDDGEEGKLEPGILNIGALSSTISRPIYEHSLVLGA